MAPQDIAGGHVAIAVLTGITGTSRDITQSPSLASSLSLTGIRSTSVGYDGFAALV